MYNYRYNISHVNISLYGAYTTNTSLADNAEKINNISEQRNTDKI